MHIDDQTLEMAGDSLERNGIQLTGAYVKGSEIELIGHILDVQSTSSANTAKLCQKESGQSIKIIVSDRNTCHVFIGRKYITAHAHACRVGECIEQQRHVGLFE